MIAVKTKEQTLEGRITRIIYRHESNGYTVAQLTLSSGDVYKIVGTFMTINIDDDVRVTGYWEKNPKHGWQFNVTFSKRIVPQSPEQIERYLGSGLIKGIGPKSAKKIVNHFGGQTLEIIKKSPYRLTEVEGIGKKKAVKIAQEILKNEMAEEALLFLKGHGIGNKTAIKIYQQYKEDTIKAIKENPYQVIDQVYGVGFHIADTIAKRVGIPEKSDFRIQAGLQYCLQKAEEDGHTYLPREKLLHGDERNKGAVALLGVEQILVEHELDKMIEQKKLIAEGDKIYLPIYWETEKKIANELKRIVKTTKTIPARSVDESILRYEKKHQVKLADKQKDAIKKVLTHGVIILTGGPGTGKTTTIKAILDVVRSYDRAAKVLLAAPTGRAAKRMSEACGEEASTIHRMLEYSVDETGKMRFQRNRKNPLDADLIIIDETSMIDVHIMYALLRAIRSGTKLVIVGDSDQLPSVGAGNVLNDLIRSEVLPTVCLNEVFRQAKESLIVQNAHRINQGKFPYLKPDNDYTNDFWFIEAETPEEIMREIQALYYFEFPQYDPLRDIQVLTPMRKTAIGIDALNAMLQSLLNPERPDAPELVHRQRHFRAGDKVMVIRNDYEKAVFNGDIGVIMSVEPQDEAVIVKLFDSHREVVFSGEEIENLTLAYACSIHKSQGSEWPCCIIVVSTAHAIMLQRNLLYTAVTRAQKQAIIIGTKKALALAVHNNYVQHRYSSLCQRLQDAFKEEASGDSLAPMPGQTLFGFEEIVFQPTLL